MPACAQSPSIPSRVKRLAKCQQKATCRIRGAAKYSPITVTDVQSDGRPRAEPRDPPRSSYLRAAVAAARHS
eukprot:scaffold11915_cov121-Isochrysis_galbana.AAC.2